MVNAQAAADFGTEYASATITYKVTIKNKACSIAAGLPPKEGDVGQMNLGTVGKAKGSTTPRLPLIFTFKDCQGVSAVQSIKYTKDLNGGQGHTQGFVSTDNDDVKIYLYPSETSNEPFQSVNYPAPNGKPIVNGEWITVCFAQAKVGPNDSQKIGNFIGRAEFTVTYN